jgi:hypothetical protein
MPEPKLRWLLLWIVIAECAVAAFWAGVLHWLTRESR